MKTKSFLSRIKQWTQTESPAINNKRLAFDVFQSLPLLLPLPKGEGRGQGEGSILPPASIWLRLPRIKIPRRQLIFGLCLVIGSFAVLGAVARNHQKGFVAHEWGTFTSFQGSDGVLLNWRPLQTSRLPDFVYNWQNPGFNRQARNAYTLGKAGMITLQRMETPVIYFYADEKQNIDVSVDFPKGVITEWYPQATQIGPSTIPAPAPIAKADELAHKVGAKSDFSFASLLKNHAAKESRARWADIEILPKNETRDTARSLLQDRSGSHYFAARDTDSAFIRTDSVGNTNGTPEYEKFIFYRGVGSFATPLRVTMQADALTIQNTGTESLDHLFVLGLQDGAGKFIPVEKLAAGEKRIVQVNLTDGISPTKKLSEQLCQNMAASLVSEGLYEREAQAMVNTWRDSWFEENGVRVLYTLPRQWTDQTLPLTLDPKPREMVRVMVGRAEVLTPAIQKKLSDAIAKAEQGDSEARATVMAECKKLGRFAEPALQKLMIVGKSNASLYSDALKAANGNS